ncbi:BZIP domain-containing protein [Fusarium keratoplasticum]|nr:BZIP domain-containing protein [Fusarium keratoplasticum]
MLERNRIAATKCRLRKRDEASALASREKAMEDRNRSLSDCFDSLTAEIYYLKTELLRHTDCNCVLIQKYIAHEAQKSVDGLLACPSAFEAHDVSLSPNDGSSSNAGTADSLNMYSLEADGIPPTETEPFQQGSRASEVSEDVVGMSLEPFHTTPMPPDSMVYAHPLSSVPLVECGPDFYDNMGPQEHQADEIGWDLHRSFGDGVTVIF